MQQLDFQQERLEPVGVAVAEKLERITHPLAAQAELVQLVDLCFPASRIVSAGKEIFGQWRQNPARIRAGVGVEPARPNVCFPRQVEPQCLALSSRDIAPSRLLDRRDEALQRDRSLSAQPFPARAALIQPGTGEQFVGDVAVANRRRCQQRVSKVELKEATDA